MCIRDRVCTVKKEFDNTPGWQHFLGGFKIETELDPSTKYFIEPRIQISEPAYSNTTASIPLAGNYDIGAERRVGASNVTVLLGNGRGLRTTDGASWTTGNAVPTANWTDLEGGANWFMAVSTDGTVARSQDGANWSDISSNLGADIFTGVAYEGSTWIVASRTGVVYRSTDEGNTWTNQQVEPYDGSTPVFHYAAAGNGLFILSNNLGQTWESIDDGVTLSLIHI